MYCDSVNLVSRARICKCLRSPGIDSKESIPPTGAIKVVPALPGWESISGNLKRLSKLLIQAYDYDQKLENFK
jgi:hypothetical protein